MRIEDLLLLAAALDAVLFVATANAQTAVVSALLRVAVSFSFWHYSSNSTTTQRESVPKRTLRCLRISSTQRISLALLIGLCAFSSTANAAPPIVLALWEGFQTVSMIIGFIKFVLSVIEGALILALTIIRFAVCHTLAFIIAVVIYINTVDAFGLVTKDFSFSAYISGILLSMLQCEPVDPDNGEYRPELFKAGDERRRSDTHSVLRASFEDAEPAVHASSSSYQKGTLLHELDQLVSLVNTASVYLSQVGTAADNDTSSANHTQNAFLREVLMQHQQQQRQSAPDTLATAAASERLNIISVI
jgi:hypothetical protein